MALDGSVQITGFIGTTFSGDTYATHDALYGRDGLKNLNTEVDLNGVTDERRRPGMLVGLSGGTKYYKLLEPGISGYTFTITDWTEAFLATSDTYVNNATLSGNTLYFDRNNNPNAFSVDLSSLVFTGNTSGGCISDLYITNLYGCSPITVHDDIQTENGVTINALNGTSTLDLRYSGFDNNVRLSNIIPNIYGTGNTVTGMEIRDFGTPFVNISTDLNGTSTRSQSMFMFGDFGYWWTTDTTDPLNEIQGGFNIYYNKLTDGIVTFGARNSYPTSASVNRAIMKAGVVNSFASGAKHITVKTSNTSYTEKLGYNKDHGSFETIISATTPTADRIQTHQDADGVIALVSDITPFTGNTSGSCITDLYITNLYGCSPITVHDNIQLETGVTINSSSGGSQIDLRYGGTNDTTVISTDSGGLAESYLWMNPTTTVLKSPLLQSRTSAFGTVMEATNVGGGLYSQGAAVIQNDALFLNTNGSQFNQSVRNSVILGGQSITASTSYTAYVPNLNIGIVGGGTSIINLGLDSNGNVVTGTTETGPESPFRYNTGTTTSIEPKLGANSTYGSYSFVGGGKDNNIDVNGSYSFISGGKDNTINGTAFGLGYSSIGGGVNNRIIGSQKGNHVIGGGKNNTITGGTWGYNVIAGGGYGSIPSYGNIIFDTNWSSIGGGYGNHIYESSSYSSIGGGTNNTMLLSSVQSSIGGGSGHVISGSTYSSILGGKSNVMYTNSDYSSIVGGQSNISYHSNTHIIGSNITTISANTTYVEGLNIGTVGTSTAVTLLATDTNGMIVNGSSLVGSVNKYTTTSGFTGSTPMTITHSLGTEDVVVNLWEDSPKIQTDGTIEVVDSNNVKITMATTATFKVVVIG